MIGQPWQSAASLGEEYVVREGPCLLLGVCASEAGGGFEPAQIALQGLDGTPYIGLMIAPNASVAYAPLVACGHGLKLTCSAGSALVSLSLV